MADISGLPYWTVRFDSQGDPDGDLRDAVLTELPTSGVSNLFVFSHGWNNTPQLADQLYRQFFGLLAGELGGPPLPGSGVGVLGVVWPSMRWPDEPIPDFAALGGGGAAAAGSQSDADLASALKAVFPMAEQQEALDRMAALLDEQPSDPRRLAEFQQLMATLDAGDEGAMSDEDVGERQLLQDDPVEVSGRMAAAAEATESAQQEGGAASIGLLPALAVTTDTEGSAAGLGDIGGRAWRGAREALRQFTYFQMKRRAGVVGEKGLGVLCTDFGSAAPEVRLHLVGHSFGARLVSFSLKAIASDLQPSPVKSMLLLQGAFSHFAFASSLPFQPSRGGALAGYASRVDGPIVVVHSVHDTAVGVLYPLASMASRDDAAALDSVLYRWGAMGYDGAQAVDAETHILGQASEPSTVPQRGFLNVNADAVVRTGGPPSGAHSDIFHSELARLALRTAGLPLH